MLWIYVIGSLIIHSPIHFPISYLSPPITSQAIRLQIKLFCFVRNSLQCLLIISSWYMFVFFLEEKEGNQCDMPFFYYCNTLYFIISKLEETLAGSQNGSSQNPEWNQFKNPYPVDGKGLCVSEWVCYSAI